MRKEQRHILKNQFVINKDKKGFVNLVDISKSGACIKTKEVLENGEIVELTLPIDNQSVKAKGRVVHLSGKDEKFVGIEFDDVVVTKIDKNRTRNFRTYFALNNNIDDFRFVRHIDY